MKHIRLNNRGSADLVLLVVAFVAIFAYVGWRALSASATAASSTTVTALPGVSFGLYQTSNNLNYSIGTSAQQKYAIQYYGWPEGLQTSEVAAVEKTGIEPFLELQTCSGSGCSPATSVPLSGVINGTYNSYLTAFGTALKATGKHALLTFDHEMNGGTSKNCGWYPWNQCYSGQSTGVTPLQWIQAWNKVTTEVNSTAGGMACWVWAPNIQNGASAVASYWKSGTTSVQNVCRAGLDGYYQNSSATWANTIQPSYTAVETASGSKHPFILAETGVLATDSNAVSQIDNLVAGSRSDGRVPIMYFDKGTWALTAAMQAEFLKDVK